MNVDSSASTVKLEDLQNLLRFPKAFDTDCSPLLPKEPFMFACPTEICILTVTEQDASAIHFSAYLKAVSLLNKQ